MPCSDGGPSRDCEDTELKNARANLRKARDKNDLYARLLCFIMSNCDEYMMNELHNAPTNEEHGDAFKELMVWWKEHQEIDRKEAARKEKEMKVALLKASAQAKAEHIKRNALLKLTLEERELLGLR